jgi:hypothetical protein
VFLVNAGAYLVALALVVFVARAPRRLAGSESAPDPDDG